MVMMNEWLSLFENGRKLRIYIWCTPKIARAVGIDADHNIHSSAVCNFFKSTENGKRSCMRCREHADILAIRRGAFSGYCVHGLYEFVNPVYYKDKCIAMVYIGNLSLDKTITQKRINEHCKKYNLCDKFNKSLISSVEIIDNTAYYRTLAEAVAEKMTLILNSQPDIQEKSEPPLVYMLRGIIHSHYDFSDSLMNIANEYHVHEKYLGRIFKKYTGYSFAAYRNKIRLQKAEELLINTDEKVINIAISVGYENVTYFNRVFQKQFGLSPLQYRREHGKIKLKKQI